MSQPRMGTPRLAPIPIITLLILAVAILACSNIRKWPDRDTYVTDDTAAPDFDLVLFGNENYSRGDRIKLSQFQGQPVVINFWFPSCPPCRLEILDLEQSWKDHEKDGVQFIGVQLLGLDTIDDGQEFMDDFGVTYAMGPDSNGKIVVDYEVRGFPSTAFLDSDHNLVRNWTGILTREKLEELIVEILW